jgi:hypothetical protein
MVQITSVSKSGWAGGDHASAPDGGMQMSREEFKEQLVRRTGELCRMPASTAFQSAMAACLVSSRLSSVGLLPAHGTAQMGSLDAVEGLPAMDEAQIEDMWLDFSKKIRAGEVSGGNGGRGMFGSMFKSRSQEGWLHIIMMAGKKTCLFCAILYIYIYKRSFYQDRLGTNIRKTQKGERRFLAGMCLTMYMRRRQRNERKAKFQQDQEVEAAKQGKLQRRLERAGASLSGSGLGSGEAATEASASGEEVRNPERFIPKCS